MLTFNNNKQSFLILLKESNDILKLMSYNFSLCIAKDTFFNCMKTNNEKYPTKHDKLYYKTHYFNKSVYDNFHTNYNVILFPTISTDIHIIVGIPIAPSELISRIAIRQTWGKIKVTKNKKKLCYLFIMSKPDNSYPFDYLIEESYMYKDILLFDFINSYKHITLLMIMSYKWIINNCSNISFFVRSNSDALLFPSRLDKLLNYNSDIIAYKTSCNKTVYPSGSFYIFSMKFAQQIVKLSEIVRPIHPTEDIYYGQIMKYLNIKNITWFGLDVYLPFSYHRKTNICIKSTSLVSIHPVTSSALYYLLH